MKLLYLILLCFAIPAMGQAPPDQQAYPETLLRVRIPQKPEPVIINAQPTLFYEVHIANISREGMVIRDFSIHTIHNGDTLLHYYGSALSRRLSTLRPQKERSPGEIVAPGDSMILYIEASTKNAQFPPLYHCIRFQLAGDTTVAHTLHHDTLRFRNPAPVVLSSPLKGGNWVAIFDPAWERGHRRVVYTVDGKLRIPGRFAIDFMMIDSMHYVKGSEDSIHNWYGYAQEVLAVADAEVASVRDDFPESPTLSAHPDHKPEQATGNFISLKLAGGRYVFYEHLKPGSIRVRPGEQVKKGQVIALLGFTGQTTGPHLHFHVADNNSPLGAEGLPFVFENFTQVGHYPDFSRFGKEKFIRIPARNVKKEMPASNSVLVF